MARSLGDVCGLWKTPGRLGHCRSCRSQPDAAGWTSGARGRRLVRRLSARPEKPPPRAPAWSGEHNGGFAAGGPHAASLTQVPHARFHDFAVERARLKRQMERARSRVFFGRRDYLSGITEIGFRQRRPAWPSLLVGYVRNTARPGRHGACSRVSAAPAILIKHDGG